MVARFIDAFLISCMLQNSRPQYTSFYGDVQALLSSFIPFFTAVNCGKPRISNAKAAARNGTTYKYQGTFDCAHGHRYDGTDQQTIQCLANGSWSIPAGECIGKIMDVHVCKMATTSTCLCMSILSILITVS